MNMLNLAIAPPEPTYSLPAPAPACTLQEFRAFTSTLPPSFAIARDLAHAVQQRARDLRSLRNAAILEMIAHPIANISEIVYEFCANRNQLTGAQLHKIIASAVKRKANCDRRALIDAVIAHTLDLCAHCIARSSKNAAHILHAHIILARACEAGSFFFARPRPRPRPLARAMLIYRLSLANNYDRKFARRKFARAPIAWAQIKVYT